MKNILTLLTLVLAFGTINSQIYINEVDADQAGVDAGEFVELYGPASMSLNGLVVVLYNGNDDQSYSAFDLDGYSLNSNGFFVLGNEAVPNVGLIFPGNGLQNGADAVALYQADEMDFPNDTPLTSENLLDYMVYDTDDDDDLELLSLLGDGPQLNENEFGQGGAHSNSRIPDGGTLLSTTSYIQQTPTPGTTNVFNCDAGILTNDELEDFIACVEDVAESTISFGNTSGAEGDTYVYIVTDILGVIQFVSESADVDFFGESIGESLVWGVSYDGVIDDATIMPGVNIANVSLTSGDCLSTSEEGVLINKFDCSAPDCDAGALSLNGDDNAFLCTVEVDLEVTFSNNSTTPEFSYQYVIADDSDQIILVQSGDSFDFDGMGTGIWNIYGISYIGTLDASTIEAGDLVSGITAETCFSISEVAIVSVSECTDGCSDLFFSEYIEGSNSNKAIEIYNPKDVPVDLSEYTINLYANGGTDPNNFLTMEGMLNPGEVYVIANESAFDEILNVADITATITFFNGDDALELVHSGITIDVIGVIGEDPGSNWPVGSGATSEYTLVRMVNINEGTTDWTVGAGQWDVYDQNEFSYLGSHIANACGSSDIPAVSITTSSQTVEEGELVTVEVSFTNPLYDVSVTMGITGGTATELVDYNSPFPFLFEFDGGVEEIQEVQFLIIDDAEEEDDETIILTLTSDTDDFQIITETQTITIEDNDAVIDVTLIGDMVVIDVNGEAEMEGEVVELRGVVYGINLRPGGLQFTLIDPTDGIGVFNLDEDFGYVVTEGDSIHVTGAIEQFNGLTQIAVDGVVFISADNDLHVPNEVTSLNEFTESDLVRINCVSIVDPTEWDPFGSGFNVDVTDGTNTYAMRIDNDVDLFGMAAPTGSFDLVGIGSQFDSSSPYFDGYQILPRYSEDIMEAVDMMYSIQQEGEDVDCIFAGALAPELTTFIPSELEGTTYIWSIGNLTFNDVSPSFDFNEVEGLMLGDNEVLLELTITNSSGCTSTIQETICVNVAGSVGNIEAFNMSLFPNPNNGSFRIEAEQQVDLIEIRNNLGQLVETIPVNGLNVFIEVEELSAGVYSVEIVSGEARVIRRIVVE